MKSSKAPGQGKTPAKSQSSYKPVKENHQKFVEEAHKSAGKPAGPAGNSFKYPIRMD